jgi:hypothetical protein
MNHVERSSPAAPDRELHAHPERAGGITRDTALALLKDYALPGLTIVGVVLYGVFRLAYLFFYLKLRTTPEEVGYGYSRILAESVIGALELVILFFLPLLLVGLVIHAGLMAWRKRRRERHNRPDRHGREETALRQPLQRIAIRAFAISVIVIVVILPMLAWWQGKLAERGQTVRNAYFIGVPYLPILAVQAIPAEVAWTNGDSERQFPLANRQCLMYLGGADGTAVFYDVQTKESVRLPTADVSIALRYTFFVPLGCRRSS